MTLLMLALKRTVAPRPMQWQPATRAITTLPAPPGPTPHPKGPALIRNQKQPQMFRPMFIADADADTQEQLTTVDGFDLKKVQTLIDTSDLPATQKNAVEKRSGDCG